MKKTLFFLISHFIALAFLLSPNISQHPAMAQCSSVCLYCNGQDGSETETVSETISLGGEITTCSETEVAYSPKITFIEGVSYIEIYRLGYTIAYVNNAGTVIDQFEDTTEAPIKTCDATSCSAGLSLTIEGIQPYYLDPDDFPEGTIEIDFTIIIEIRQSTTEPSCWIDSLTNSSSCNFDEWEPPEPGGECTSSLQCGGVDNECLPTQICVDGECIFPLTCSDQDEDDCVYAGNCGDPNYPDACCHCTPGYNCGAGGCPPTHWCWLSDSGHGICLPDPDNCHSCSQSSEICGEECNLLQRCINGWCEFDELYCLSLRKKTHHDVFCIGDNPDVRTDTPPDPENAKVATAIGCIPVTSQQAFVEFLLKWGAGIAGGIALVLIAVAGIMFVTSAGDPKRMQAAKELLTAAISGLLLLIFGVFVLEFIGVDILGIPGFGS